MDYELAAALRDAGFPQNGDGKRIGSPHAIYWRNDDRAYVPTLSELISDCGESFASLRRNEDGTFTARAYAVGTALIAKYDTPEEAVARLVLSLASAAP